MMNKKYVTNKIRTQIAGILENEGFKYIKSNERIIRKHEYGFDVIIIKVLDYAPVFQLQMSLRVRINQVEDIVNKFQEYSFASPQFMKYTETEGVSYMVLSGARENYIEIETEKELDKAINEFIKIIQDKGLAFFEKHRNLEIVNAEKKNQILNKEHDVIGNLMQSLTLMKLCEDTDFDKLCEKYKELYVPWVGQEITGRTALDNLIKYLKAM